LVLVARLHAGAQRVHRSRTHGAALRLGLFVEAHLEAADLVQRVHRVGAGSMQQNEGNEVQISAPMDLGSRVTPLLKRRE
jgi:hypothetical protein